MYIIDVAVPIFIINNGYSLILNKREILYKMAYF